MNIQLLCKCMLRLKIPTSFINLILNFFIKCTNAIIIFHSITTSYQMKVGIDQGEVIFLLLWTIYYNPLFCRIKNLQQKYITLLYRLTSINLLQYKQLKVKCNLLGYLDDTTWIASSKEELKYMLFDSYYTFMNIKINKQKSILITNNTSHMTNNHTTLKFSSEHITFPNISKDQSIRFLGI